MINFIRRWFTPETSPSPGATPMIAAYPDGMYQSAQEALAAGIELYWLENDGRRAVISWQGEGGRAESYQTREVWLEGKALDLSQLSLDPQALCTGLGLDPARQHVDAVSGMLGVEDSTPSEVALLLERIFVHFAGMKPFSDTQQYALAMEYEPADATSRAAG